VINATSSAYTHTAPRDWLITIKDDGAHGFNWWVSRHNVLWAKGWTRGRDPKKAETLARQTAAQAFADEILNPHSHAEQGAEQR
jgi:hypothetical protein